MPRTYLERRRGGGGEDPKEDELRAAIAELSKPDAEHPDCWLSDENNLTISAFESGRVVLENPETNEGPWHLKSQSQEAVLELWQLLQRGDIHTIRSKPWQCGYGQTE